MKKKEFHISHPYQLNSLSTIPLYRKAGLGIIALDHSFQHPKREELVKSLNKNYHACGCDTGAKAFLLGIVFFGLLSFYTYASDILNLRMSVVLLIGGPVVLSFIGKFYGLVKANSKLKETIREIKTVWRVEMKNTNQLIICA